MPEIAVPPFDLGPGMVVHFADDLGARPVVVEPSFWTHAGDGQQPELAMGRVMCIGDYTETWEWSECHPVGDELAVLISGGVDLFLSDDTGSASVALLPGQAAIVPAGTWHRAVVRAPSRMLFVTPTPARTLMRPLAVEERGLEVTRPTDHR
jgi:hypothetical protein